MNKTSITRRIVYAVLTGIALAALSYTGYNPVSFAFRFVSDSQYAEGLALMALVLMPTVNFIIGVAIGLFVEKISRAWPYWIRGAYIGVIIGLWLFGGGALLPEEERISWGGFNVVVVVSIIVSIIYGKIKNRNKSVPVTPQVPPAPQIPS